MKITDLRTSLADALLVVKGDKREKHKRVPVNVLKGDGDTFVQVSNSRQSSTTLCDDVRSIASSLVKVRPSRTKSVRSLETRSRGNHRTGVTVTEFDKPPSRRLPAETAEEDEHDAVGEHTFVGSLLWGRRAKTKG